MKEALNEECDYEKAQEKFNKYLEKGYYVFFKPFQNERSVLLDSMN